MNTKDDKQKTKKQRIVAQQQQPEEKKEQEVGGDCCIGCNSVVEINTGCMVRLSVGPFNSKKLLYCKMCACALTIRVVPEEWGFQL